MAGILGEHLLAEVRMERLDEVLRSLRTLDQLQPIGRLGVPALDNVLDVFTSPTVRRQELNTQWDTPPQPQTHPPGRSPKPPVLEICGTNPCSGKTQLLYHIAAVSLCPPVDNATLTDEGGGAVIWIDSDSRFNIQRLRSILQSYISGHSNGPKTPPYDTDTLVSKHLQHLHVFQPGSSATLLATLQSIPRYLLAVNSHYSSLCPLKALIISNISAFVPQDRLQSSLEPTDASTKQDGTSFTRRYRDIVHALRDAQTLFSCTIIAGNIALSPLQSSRPGLSHRSHLPGAWTSFCAAKIFVARKMTLKFRPGTSAEEALLESMARKNAVRSSGFWGWVDMYGSDEWEIGVREGVERLGPFEFTVDEQGVSFGTPGGGKG